MQDKKEHRALALKEFQDDDYADVLKRPVFCSRQGHQKEELKYYCKECETALCQTCVTLEHGGHGLKLIEEEAESQRLEIKSVLQSQKQKLEAKMKEVTQLDDDYAELIQQSEIVKRDVQRFADGLIKTIQGKVQKIVGAVEGQRKKSLESLATKRNEIEHQINAMQSSLEEADKLFQRSTNAEVVQLKKSLQTIFEGVDQTKPIARDTATLEAFIFNKNQKMLEIIIGEEIGTLGVPSHTKANESVAEGKGLKQGNVGRKAQFNLITRNVKRQRGYDKRDRVTVEIKDEQERECVTEVRINDNKNGIYNISYYPKVQGTLKLSVKVNGEHICGSLFNVIVKPFHVKPVSCFGKHGSSNGMFRGPQAVAVTDGDEIVVVDNKNHRLQEFDSNGTFLRSIGRYGKNAGEFIYPNGIAIDKDKHIFVSDMGNHRVQILSWEGKHLGSFGSVGKLDSQLYSPWGLSLDSNGNVIVADGGNELIKIFTPDGRFVMKIGGQGSFSFPIHCVQCGEYLIVSDDTDHCIKVFNRDGNFQYKFGNFGGGDGELKNPRFLSVTQSKHLLVSDGYNHRIQVFKLDGEFVGKFGTLGSELGEFSGPFSVAVLSNDQIVVSDERNHRVQIFE